MTDLESLLVPDLLPQLLGHSVNNVTLKSSVWRPTIHTIIDVLIKYDILFSPTCP